MRLLFAALAAVLASGCALTHTPLRQRTSLYAPNEPAALASLARREVHRGFTAEMVERALGLPQQIRAQASGPTLQASWIYLNEAGGTTHIVLEHDRVVDILHVR